MLYDITHVFLSYLSLCKPYPSPIPASGDVEMLFHKSANFFHSVLTNNQIHDTVDLMYILTYFIFTEMY